MLPKKQYLLSCAASALLFTNIAMAGDEPYWLCGPDEDGCPADGYQYCYCIPKDAQNADTPYCLDFDELSCAPLKEKPNCNPHFIFKNQTSCLATIFQSMPDNPCTLTTKSFCENNKTLVCDKSGKLDSCKRIA